MMFADDSPRMPTERSGIDNVPLSRTTPFRVVQTD
jgi:hypothetical protein